jgi:uncharacterized membrane protein
MVKNSRLVFSVRNGCTLHEIKSSTRSQIHSFNPAIVLIIFGLIIGLILCLFIPYGAGMDEEQHTIRIFDISGLHLIPNRSGSQGNYSPSGFFSLAYSNQFFRSPALYQFDKEFFYSKIDWQNMNSGKTDATYFPVIYFPEAFVAGLAWRVFNFPIFPTIILMRLVGFLLYLLACYLTIKILPIGKWIFLVLALTPTALFQASTLSADGFTIAVCFLFIGLVLQTLWGNDKSINMNEGWKIFAVSLLVGSAKSGTIIILLLLFLLLFRKFESKRVKAVILSGAILSAAISVGWTVLFSNISSNGLNGLPSHNTFSEQIVLVLMNLNNFIPMYLKGIILSFTEIYRNIVGEYSYWGRSFNLIYYLSAIALLFAFLAETKNNRPKINERIFMFLVALICVFLIGSVIYVISYIPNHQQYGSHGRYLIPFIPILFLSWAAFINPPNWLKQIASIITISLVVLLDGVYLIGFYRVFYSNCLNTFIANNSCTLPIYQNLDVNSLFPVDIGSKNGIDQSFIPQCSVISNIEIRALPESANNNVIVKFSLFDKDNHLLRTSEDPISAVKSDRPTSFPFAKIEVNNHETYHFNLKLIKSQSSEIILNAMGIKEDFYKDGALSMNGKPIDNARDLVFQYTCNP